MKKLKYNLSHAVALLNFERENRQKARTILRREYEIPPILQSSILNKIFFRLGFYPFKSSPIPQAELWKAFHSIAFEEIQQPKEHI